MGRSIVRVVVVTAVLFGLSSGVGMGRAAQEKPKPAPQEAEKHKAGQLKETETVPGQQTTPAESPSMKAVLVDAEDKARKGEATVQVTVSGVEMVDPASANNEPKAGQGHLHYRVDDGPIIATPTTKLSFHGLSPGEHKITIILAANDHSPLGPEQVLIITVPEPPAAQTGSTR